MLVRDRMLALTELFLGALWADDEFNEDEQKAVRKLLADLLRVTNDTLPDAVEDRIRTFDPLSFDLAVAAQDFVADPPMAKRRLLELVGMMADADGVVEMKEREYLRELAGHLGLEYDDYENLMLAVDIEELRETFESLRSAPPPLVDGSGRASKPPPPPLVSPNQHVEAAPPPVNQDD